MIQFHESSMPCLDATHYYAYCEDDTTVGDAIDSALDQVVEKFRAENGFDPTKIKFEVSVKHHDEWEEFQVADGENNAVVPDEIRALMAECAELTYWPRGYKFILSLYGKEAP